LTDLHLLLLYNLNVHHHCLGNWNKLSSCQREFLISHINDEAEITYKRNRSSETLTAPRRVSHTFSLQYQNTYQIKLYFVLIQTAERAYSVLRINTGWTIRGSNSGGGEIFRARLDSPRGPPTLL